MQACAQTLAAVKVLQSKTNAGSDTLKSRLLIGAARLLGNAVAQLDEVSAVGDLRKDTNAGNLSTLSSFILGHRETLLSLASIHAAQAAYDKTPEKDMALALGLLNLAQVFLTDPINVYLTVLTLSVNSISLIE